MKPHHPQLGVLLGILLASTALSQAFSIPSADALIELKLTLPTGETANVSTREGAMLTVSDARNDYKYSFIVSLDQSSRQWRLLVLEVRDEGDRKESANMLGDLRVLNPQNETVIETPEGNFGIDLLGVKTGDFEDPALPSPLKDNPDLYELQRVYGKGAGVCCVTCNSITVCATSVKLSCGACDAGGGHNPPAI